APAPVPTHCSPRTRAGRLPRQICWACVRPDTPSRSCWLSLLPSCGSLLPPRPAAVYALCASLLLCGSCSRSPRETQPSGPVTVVLKHQPLWGDPAPFHAFLDRFRRDNPDVLVRTETLPNASDVAREMFLTALEGGADDFDVFSIDVVWASEFARAGWLADVSGAF